MSDLYIEARLQAIKDIASTSCSDIKDADNIASFCDEIYSAIEIVKQGGISEDMCEHRQLDGCYKSLFITSCGYIYRMGNNFKFCPHCGKKIKIIGD